MNKGSVLLDLRPNRLLLNPSFDGYKLSLDSIPIYKKKIESGIYVKQLEENQYSFSHVKIFSLHNHLYVNPYKLDSVYIVDKNCEVLKIALSPLNEIVLSKVAYQISRPPKAHLGSYNVSILFPSNDSVLVSAGCGAVYLINIKMQGDSELWDTPVLVCQYEIDFVLSDARFVQRDDTQELNFLNLYVKEKTQEEKEKEKLQTGLFQTLLEWNTFKQNENCTWEKTCQKKISVDGSVDYAALEPGCLGVLVISDKLPKWAFDSEEAVVEELHECKSKKNIYSWTQTENDITVWLPLAEGTVKPEIEVSVTQVRLEIKVKGEIIISDDFFHRVDNDLTSWIFEKNNLEIHLTKAEGLMWKTLLPQNDEGEEILDPEVINNIHQKLAHLCSEKDEGESGCQSVFNSQQLEECDNTSCDSSTLVRIDGKKKVITHQISLSSCQWLFKVSCEASQTPAICCRHDVDACVWQFREIESDGKTWPYEHIGTFFAFGYVQASKTLKKFVASPPNLSYVAICEASHHIYIYRQPSPLSTELKNRSTGRKINMISKQQLVNLESKEQILGVHATNNFLYVLLETSICILVINRLEI